MALETTITERDKKLLVFLAIFLIVIGFSWLVIKPGIDQIFNTNLEIQKAESEQEKIRFSMKMIPQISEEITEMNRELISNGIMLYEKLESQQVDNLITSLVINNGFNRNDIRNLEIDYPDQYTTMYKYKEEETKVSASAASGTEVDTSLKGIFGVQVTLSVYGTRESIQPLINTIATDYDAIQMRSFTWQPDNVNENFYTTTMEMTVYMTDNNE